MNSDWSAVTSAGSSVLSATRANFASTLSLVGYTMVSGQDSFYFWSFDHGFTDGTQGSGLLIGWNTEDLFAESIYTSEISSLLSPITAKKPIWEAYVMTQCFAGDFLYGLGISEADTNRFFAYAAEWDEESWDYSFADSWAEGLESGLTSTHALGDYAVENDIYGQYGTAEETPGYVGGDFLLPVPEPATWTLFGGLGALGVALLRRRKSRL